MMHLPTASNTTATTTTTSSSTGSTALRWVVLMISYLAVFGSCRVAAQTDEAPLSGSSSSSRNKGPTPPALDGLMDKPTMTTPASSSPKEDLTALTSQFADDYMLEELTDWVKTSPGAYISDKVALRRATPNDPSSVRGIFANHDIAKSEVLFTIPWHIIIRAKNKTDTEYIYGFADSCETIQSIYHEMKSEATPYGRYLKVQPTNYLPALWTPQGQELLEIILDDYLPPIAALEQHLKNDLDGRCESMIELEKQHEGDAFDRDLLVHAWMLVEARADADLMIPYYDMINHANGEKYNAHHVLKIGESLTLVAAQEVMAGQELHASYNQCNICGTLADEVGTPEIFRSYGFVEDYPRRYILEEWNQQTFRIKFDIHKNAATGELTVAFLVPLCQEAANFLGEELLRLQDAETLCSTECPQGIPAWEWETAWTLHRAYLDDFSIAFEASKHVELTSEVWKMGHSWHYSFWKSWKQLVEKGN